MTNETLRRKIASTVSYGVSTFQNPHTIADAILATIKTSVPELVWVVGDHSHLYSGAYEISFSGNRKRAGLHVHQAEKTERHLSGDNSDDLVESFKRYAQKHHVAQLTDWMMG